MSHKYIVENEQDLLWGMSITTVGMEHILPGESYPTAGHKDGYSFEPSKGRVLQEYQLLYFPEGRGAFRSEHGGEHSIQPGWMALLFPGERHTYRPDPACGWKQFWIGFKGDIADRMVRNGFLAVDNPIFHLGYNEEIVRLYMRAMAVTEREEACFQQVLTGIVTYLLGLMYSIARNRKFNKNQHLVDRINKARLRMYEEMETPVTVQEIVQDLNMSYSSFRKLFKEYTGISPAHYFQDIKLQRAKDLLSTTQLPIKDIAYKLNFETPEYFSAQFKKKIGKKPTEFRE